MKLLNWFLASSADPEAMGLTIKGILVLLTPLIATHFGLDADTSNQLADTLAKLLVDGLALVGTAMTAFGLIRKMWLGRWAHPFSPL
jgi:hypothetical protein